MAREISEYLLKIAPKNICEPAKKNIPDMDVNDLLDLFIENINYCISEGYPSQEDLVKFGGDRLAAKNIFIDGEVKISDPDRIIAMGHTLATVDISGFVVSQLYFLGKSTIDLHVGQNAFVMVDAFDHAKIEVFATGQSKVIINLYGSATATYTAKNSATIKVVYKNKITY